MANFNFELGPIRPPDEADSLLIRTTRGCPWNKCKFCTLFKGSGFSFRKVDEIKEDIQRAREFYGDREFENCFLQDGDSFIMKTGDLIEVLTALREAFPSLRQISSYGRAGSMIRKSPEEMKEIRSAGLNMLYCGMESGSDRVLELQNKGTTSAEIIESCRNAEEAGMKTMMFMLLGLGGKELSEEHIGESARVINSINPQMIRILTLAAKPGTPLGDMVREGRFTMLTEAEMIGEQRRLVSLLDGIESQYGNYHSIDLLTGLKGDLPRDKKKLLAEMDSFLNLSREKQDNFVLGKRLWWYGGLQDLNDTARFAKVEEQLRLLRESGQNLEEVCHGMRQRMI